jgi:DNA polymerase III epsilon subunit-like protein
MYLFFDTETTGLPKSWKAPVTDTQNWPRMVQLAWQLYDENQQVHESFEYIIRPEGYTIPAEAARVHGITTERAIAEGQDLTMVLNKLRDAMLKADYLVAHNISFDEKIVGAEFLRKSIQSLARRIPRVCTMQSATDYCKLPSKSGNYGSFKYPNLTELHTKLFGRSFDSAHTALADVKACADSFFELKRLGIIKL